MEAVEKCLLWNDFKNGKGRVYLAWRSPTRSLQLGEKHGTCLIIFVVEAVELSVHRLFQPIHIRGALCPHYGLWTEHQS